MIFQYKDYEYNKRIIPLCGANVRWRTVVPIIICGPGGWRRLYATLDSGSDDTLFPSCLASSLGVDLTDAPTWRGEGVGGKRFEYPLAQVQLRLSDNFDVCIWDAIVGFTDKIEGHALLGHSGCIKYLDISFLGSKRQILVEPNPSFRGRQDKINHRSQ